MKRLLALLVVAGSVGLMPAAASATVNCGAGSAPAPAAVTGAASAVTATGATLRGTVNPNGCATTYHFQYGPTISYGSTTAATSAGSGTSSIAATTAIGGLLPSHVYHFRIVASSAGGTVDGGDMTFQTRSGCAGTPPTVAMLNPTGVSARTANLRGTVNPNGCATTYHFQYGTTIAYGSVTPARNAGSGTAAVIASSSISQLAQDTVYHFRIVATNSGGTTEGGDVSFQTARACVHGATPPSVSGETAGNITMSGALLRAIIDPNDCLTSVRFQYGLTTRYGYWTPWRRLGGGISPLTATAPVGRLSAGTVYHFRVMASSDGGPTVGADATFKTAAAPVPSTVVITTHRRAYVRHRFVVGVHLACAGGALPCAGIVKIFGRHHLIGSHGFFLAANGSGVVRVTLNRRGRRLIRDHRQLPAEIVARTPSAFARRNVLLIRRL
jgi:hypothetical protein